ncbi:MAG: tetratricopeptide repeat protein [Rickettsiales bacterium]|jgi:tetratricopeptide (TPR) repeat protein|nr:tetratricopeptide repeat protein [Rickettsiales bacterium]
MIEFLAKFLVKNNFKITCVLILTPIIWQFKPIIYSSLIGLYSTVPSFNKTYDSLISLRAPFANEHTVSAQDEFIKELIPGKIYNKYPPEIMLNLKASIRELLRIERDNQSHLFKRYINDALQDLRTPRYNKAKNIFLTKYQNSTSDEDKSKYMIYVGNLEVFEDPNFALSYYDKAFSYDQKNYNALNNIGHIYRLMGEYDKALLYYSKLAHIALDTGKWSYVANATSNIGVVYQEMDEYSLAKKYYFEALEINNKLSNDLRAATQYYNLGSIYEEMNRMIQACDKYRKARIIFYRNYREALVNNLDKKLKEINCH